MRSLLIGLALWGLAYLLVNLQFSSGAIEIGRGALGAYILPFAPLLAALGLAAAGTVVFVAGAIRS